MDGQVIRSGLAELLHIPDGPVDHQVHVQGQGSDPPQGCHHGNADGDIGDEQAVHHVHMNPVGAAFCDGLHAGLQIGKICRENGRCDQCHK